MSVNKQHSQYKYNWATWKKCRDVIDGQRSVHEAGTTYLPALDGMDLNTEKGLESYRKMLARSAFFNGTGRSEDTYLGLLFRKQPRFELPTAIEYVKDDVDGQGTDLTSFAADFAKEIIDTGRAGVLVDFEGSTAGFTLAQARQSGLKPYLACYPTERITNWHFEGGKAKFIVLEESYNVIEDNEFDVKTKTQYRSLSIDENGNYLVRIWREDKEGQWIVYDARTPKRNGQPLKYIPFYICNADGSAPGIVSKPPLLDLVDMNLSHYLTNADLERAAFYSTMPTPYASGVNADTDFPNGFTIGPAKAHLLADKDAKLQYMEIEGKSIPELRNILANKKESMANLGARFLASEKKAAETAETEMIRRQGEHATLGDIGNRASAVLTRALKELAEWSGANASDVAFKLNTDFLPKTMSPQLLKELVAAHQAGAMPFDTLWKNLQKGEIADNETSSDDAKEMIESEVI
ncbi:DUF4055 domain-containing protein [Idiomarina piscisalsi]|uniref:DUF4055 domain-containing protein n=1 Tax=Idiomarina piscisalsi TaxID=1096243 RepID=A0A432YXE8_9GAMM|nr:DUF4055 domain-containing protein [Idiomarina piscisalsi]RUO68000.1 hypothetical protein CWI73_03850 [Idiomarina piscisalsi]